MNAIFASLTGLTLGLLSPDEAARVSVAETADPSLWVAIVCEDAAQVAPLAESVRNATQAKPGASFAVLRPADVRPSLAMAQCGPGGCAGGSCGPSFAPVWQAAVIQDANTVAVVKRAEAAGLPRVVAIFKATGRVAVDEPLPQTPSEAAQLVRGL